MAPTEDDFGEPTILQDLVEVALKASGATLSFSLIGSTLSLSPPVITGSLGAAPKWEAEWLARKVATEALHRSKPSEPARGVAQSITNVFPLKTDMVRKVLIVEDDLSIADRLEAILEVAGYDVCGIACRLAEAVEISERHNPDLGVIDMRLMDGEYGTDVAVALRQRGSVGVLYSTGNPDHPLLDHAQGEGCLAKPYSGRSIVAALRVVDERMHNLSTLSAFPKGFRLLGA